MISLEKFKQIVTNENQVESAPSAKRAGASSRFGLPGGRQLTTKTEVSKAPFVRRLLDEAGLGDEGDLSWELNAVFNTTDPALTVSSGSERNFRQHLPKEVPAWRSSAHHTLIIEPELSGRELLGLRLFRNLRSEQRLEDALVRVAQGALRGYERRHNQDSSKGARQQDTLCVVAVRDDRKFEKEDAPLLVCFATQWVDPYSGEKSLVHFFLKQACVDWEPQIRDSYLTQIYERYFCKLNDDLWQRAFITSEEWQAAKKVLEGTGPTDEESDTRGDLEALLEEVASNFPLSTSEESSGRLCFDYEREHTIGLDPDSLRNDPGDSAFEATLVRDNEEHLLGYIMYCLDSAEEADALREKFRRHNCFNNVLLVAPNDEGALEIEVWQGKASLRSKLVQSGAQESPEAQLLSTVKRFLVVSQSEVESAEALAIALAQRAKYLRVYALAELRDEQENADDDAPLLELYTIFNDALAKQTEEQFADAYAQTLAYGLLSARWMARGSGERFSVAKIGQQLPSTSPFLVDLFTRLVEIRDSDRLTWLIDDLVRLLERTAVSTVFDDEGHDPVIHFYEDFLDAYDPQLRAEMGVYYTPDEVVRYIVKSTHRRLIEDFDLPYGLADDTEWREFAAANDVEIPEGVEPDEPFVQILDPAVGTGTFLKHTIDVIFETKMTQWAGENWEEDAESNMLAYREDWCNYVRAELLPRLNGFELMMAPYIVCHLRLGLTLEQTGFTFGDEDRLRVFLTNTLEMHTPSQLTMLGEHVAEEAEEAEALKSNAAITVTIGNPPYDRVSRSSEDGSELWVLDGDVPGRDGSNSLFDDILDVAREHTNFAHHASLYNLYVYFWRWAMWKTLEEYNVPGIVSYITANSWLTGPGFIGVRKRAREVSGKIEIVDLGGDNKGANTEPNVFNIETPVAVASMVRTERSEGIARAHYRKIEGGSRQAKLDAVELLTNEEGVQSDSWESPSSKPMAKLVPRSGAKSWMDMPALKDIFPWQQPGCKFGRLWPIAPHPDVLRRRWKKFVSSSEEDRPTLFHTTSTGRNIHTNVRGMKKRLVELTEDAEHEPICRYGYRSFDRQCAFDDPRMAKTESPSLWQSQSERQVYLTTMITKQLGEGPALTCTAAVPDLDYYCGRGGKDVIPLFRDAECEHPNVTSGLLSAIGNAFGRSEPTPEELAAYTYALLSSFRYQERFEEELKTPGPRVPLTKNPELWDEAVELGSRLLWLHTYAEQFKDPKVDRGEIVPLVDTIQWSKPVSQMPETTKDIGHNDETQVLSVGDGRVEGVTREVWEFSVSGMQVVRKWLGYRTRQGAGRAKHSDNPLDQIRMETWPDEWSHELLELLSVLTRTVAMQPDQGKLLDRICDGGLLDAEDLPEPTAAERKVPKTKSRKERKSRQQELALDEV